MLKNLYTGLVPKELLLVCEQVASIGGRSWIVGGSVRDLLLGIQPKDWDVEVYGLSYDVLTSVLGKHGRCEFVGKKFGVSKLWVNGYEIDVALPRTEIKKGLGHTGFGVATEPNIEPKKAALRRDFTINAMMFDPLNQELLDFYSGVEDLKQRTLRHVSNAFSEDPLRPLRAMQFAARYKLTLAEETKAMCKNLLPEASTLSGSRVWQEWKKWSTSSYPSFGLRALKDMGWLAYYPELGVLVDCPQHQRWHPEGDVWSHTCLVVDQVAKLSKKRSLSECEHETLAFAALCHDMGKPKTTYVNDQGEVVAPEHELVGVTPAKAFLDSIFVPKRIKHLVPPLVREHVSHFKEDLSETQILHLANNLVPANISLWEILTEADASGCNPMPPRRPALAWLDLAKELCVLKGKSAPIVTGEVLLTRGWEQSPQLGSVLVKAYNAQLDGEFYDAKSAYSWLQKNAVATQQK